ncbi:hypothetical protein AX16_006069 [Volvariella volvacea WC 439]|nr:hypothetical protein AX16_006069 [Volvariella volvacea WC 439]
MKEPIEARLPPELEHTIFELAARICRTKTLPTLMLVARRVRHWLRPLLFEIVALSSDQTSRPLINYPRFPIGPETHYIKRLLMHYGYDGTSRRDQRLTTAINSPHRTVAPPGLGLLRMSLYLSYLFPSGEIDFRHEIFRDLTHWEILDAGDTIQWEDGNNFGCLPKLRYLSFVEAPMRIDIIQKCLEECRGLRVLILDGVENGAETYHRLVALTRTNHDQVEGSMEILAIGESDRSKGLRGHRIVINPVVGSGGSAENWVAGGNEGDVLWAYADAIVQERLERLTG